MKYNKPEMEVVYFEQESVIITSFGDGGEGGSSNEPVIKPGIGDNWD